MKTIYNTASSLDGFIADEQNSLEWLFQFGDPEGYSFDDFLNSVGAIAMGSTTYQWLLDHHVAPVDGPAQPWPYKMPAWVFTSRQLPGIPEADVRFVQGDVRPVHAEMAHAAGGQNLWIVGGGELAGQFYDAGLLDELIVCLASTTLGRGAPLFPRTPSPPLKLQAARTFGDAFVELRYEVPRPAERS